MAGYANNGAWELLGWSYRCVPGVPFLIDWLTVDQGHCPEAAGCVRASQRMPKESGRTRRAQT